MAIVEQHHADDENKIKTQLKGLLILSTIILHTTLALKSSALNMWISSCLMIGLISTSVFFLMTSSSSFPPLQAAMAYITNHNDSRIPDCPRQDFEAATSTLSPHCPSNPCV